MSTSERYFSTTLLAAIASCAIGVGASCSNCPEPAPVESGKFVVTDLAYGDLGPSDEWLVETLTQASVSIDSDNDIAVIRYARDGTIYEVTYTLDRP